MPASRSHRAMILAPRSCPSRPGLATTTRIGPAIASRVYTRSLLGRCEHHEHGDRARDRVEAVLGAGLDEDDRPRADRPVVAADPEPAAAGHHVVELVLAVRRLRILLARPQHIEAGAHRFPAQEL